MAEGRRGDRKNKVIGAFVAGLSSDSYQKRPYFPDLLHQPDLLVVPELGRVVVLFVYEIKRRVGWGSALAWLEDLIEVKLNVGQYALVSAIVMAELEDIAPSAEHDIDVMLRRTFDGFYLPNDWEPHFLAGDLHKRLIELQRSPALSQFLAGEREQVSAELRRFDETRYRPLVDKGRIPELPLREAEDRIAHLIAESIDTPVQPGRLIPSIKGRLGQLGRRYWFKFDVGIERPLNLAIDVIQSARLGSREELRYLMAKGRLLRYGFDGERLRARRPDFRPTLIVDGNISGPDHDPYRYVRALLSVGWELFALDQIAQFRELLEHGHL